MYQYPYQPPAYEGNPEPAACGDGFDHLFK